MTEPSVSSNCAAAPEPTASADLRQVTVAVDGKPHRITPLKGRQFGPFMAQGGERLLALGTTLPVQATAWLATLSEQDGKLFHALSVATDLPMSVIEDQQADVLIALTAAVTEVNLDFFAQRAAPTLVAARIRLVAAAKRLGFELPAKSSTARLSS
ncbi:hypothetical protein [Nevskia sp.]|uniref:hypothetical protein n=1 Tax=Nevskia sp. TaxID=1929292 RepID=UPI0025E621EC|nr:hypothetical protein [Nevskia sp.]